MAHRRCPRPPGLGVTKQESLTMQTPASGCAYLEMRKEGRTLAAECSQKTQEKAGPCLKSHPTPGARTRVEPGGVKEAPRRQEMWQRLRKQANPRLWSSNERAVPGQVPDGG